MPSPTQRDELLALARQMGVITTREVDEAGIHRQMLTRLVRDGTLERIDRGRYQLPGHDLTEHHDLVHATAAVPESVVCLISALSFHGVGTQIARCVYLAVERGRREPRVEWPPVEIVRFSGPAFTEGIETHKLEGRDVRVYNLAKTLADIFKYRNKIGLDVALETLGEVWRDRRLTMDEILRYARICRVHRVMQPYLESLVL